MQTKTKRGKKNKPTPEEPNMCVWEFWLELSPFSCLLDSRNFTFSQSIRCVFLNFSILPKFEVITPVP